MIINRHNYEEYFILYMDNELSNEERRQVEDFVQRHPDLKEELDLLFQYKIQPDTNIVFEGKEELMIHNGYASISLANYEEWLTMYIDNELSSQQRTEIEDFVAAHPQIKKEFEILQWTRLQPEEIIFTDKESLYRREEKIRAMPWWRIAAAAVLLLGISIATIVLLNNNSAKIHGDTAKSDPIKKSINSTTNNKSGSESRTNEQVVRNTDDKQDKIQLKEKHNVIVKHNTAASKNKNEPPLQIKKNEPVLANNDNEKKKTNELTQPTDNPYVNGLVDINKTKDYKPKDIPSELTNPGKKTDDPVVTVSHIEPSDQIEQPTGKKSKLRGFLRKVTRTFEKNTNINATDNEERILIGGLALKLK